MKKDIEDIYRGLITVYLLEELELSKYDKMISENPLGFRKNSEEKMDDYQFVASKWLKFFYCRNNIYVDRLNNEEIDFLNMLKKRGFNKLNDEMKVFIKNTFSRVTKEEGKEKNKRYRVFYGPKSSSFFAPNDALVIGMNFDEFFIEEDMSSKEWYERSKKQDAFLKALYKEMKEEISNKVSIPVAIIQYNEFSIKKREK